MTTIENLHLSGSEHGQIAIMGEHSGARYHIWLDRCTLQPADGWLYKNDNDYPTLKLDQTRGIGAKIVPQMLEAAKRLAPAFEAEMQAKRDQAARDQERARRDQAIREAAHDLLAALKEMREHLLSITDGLEDPEDREVIEQADAAIAKAEGN